MRVLVVTLGTRGDLELFLALARELSARGHETLVATSEFHARRVEQSGLAWARAGRGDRDELIGVLRALAPIEDKTERTQLLARRWLGPQLAALREQLPELAAAADYFVSNLKLAVARDGRVLPGAAVTYDPPLRIADHARLGLAAHGGRILELVAMNERLVDPTGAWDPRYRFTGFWDVAAPPDWSPAPDLVRFLEDGPPPVALTLGSMATFDAERLIARTSEALELTGRRAIVVGGWSRLDRGTWPTGSVRLEEEIPYDWLFPRTCCVIHHGGCGTTAAVLRAGKPSILLPQIACQVVLGSLLRREHLVAGVLDAATLEARELAAAIESAVRDERLLAQAETWRAIIARDGGVRAAADWIGQHGDEIRPE